MVITTEYADIFLPGSPMRTFVAVPKTEAQYPGIWCYSDIFRLTAPLLRFAFGWPVTDLLPRRQKFIAGSSRQEP
jgi:hypothetical protein